MYQDMTIKCQSVHLFTRTHDVVDAESFQEVQKSSEILTDKEKCSGNLPRHPEPTYKVNA